MSAFCENYYFNPAFADILKNTYTRCCTRFICPEIPLTCPGKPPTCSVTPKQILIEQVLVGYPLWILLLPSNLSSCWTGKRKPKCGTMTRPRVWVSGKVSGANEGCFGAHDRHCCSFPFSPLKIDAGSESEVSIAGDHHHSSLPTG